MAQPHDNWAEYYDFVYENSYGKLYNELTQKSIQVITQLNNIKNIFDFGCGTGRLAVPLAQNGYTVYAFDKSTGMLDEVIRKRDELNLKNLIIQERNVDELAGKIDLALAVFTVLNYIISDSEMDETISLLAGILTPNGRVFIDIPYDNFFLSTTILSIKGNPTRKVWLNEIEDSGVYEYNETCSGNFNGKEFSYSEHLQIRHWKEAELLEKFNKAGFTKQVNLTKNFPRVNSSYYILEKEN